MYFNTHDWKMFCNGMIDKLDPLLISYYNKTFQPYNHIKYEQELEPYLRDVSIPGFILPGDNILELFNKDKELMGDITYDQIADILQTIIEKTLKAKRMCNSDKQYKDLNNRKLEKLQLHDVTVTTGYCCIKNVPFMAYKNENTIIHPYILDDKYVVCSMEHCGYQHCPFYNIHHKDIDAARCVTGGGDDYWVYDLSTGKSLNFCDLNIHLIRDHGFFENGPCRLDPKYVIDFFGLQKGVDYSCKYEYILQWKYEELPGIISPCKSYGEENIIEIKEEKSYEWHEPVVMNRMIRYPEYRTPSLHKVMIITKQRNRNNNEYNIVIDGLELKHLSDRRVDATYVLKYQRQIIS